MLSLLLLLNSTVLKLSKTELNNVPVSKQVTGCPFVFFHYLPTHHHPTPQNSNC